jgi:hypothetical protein
MRDFHILRDHGCFVDAHQPNSGLCRRTLQHYHLRRSLRDPFTRSAAKPVKTFHRILLFPLSSDGSKTFRPVSYDDLDAVFRSDLKVAGYNSSKFAGHNFRIAIGAAVMLAHAVVRANITEDMGGWARGSAALSSYMRVRAPPNLRRRCVKDESH